METRFEIAEIHQAIGDEASQHEQLRRIVSIDASAGSERTSRVRYLAARAHVEFSRCERQDSGGAVRETDPASRPRQTGAGREKRPTLREAVAELERRSIVDALYEVGGNQTRAALALGLTRKGLASKMRRYGVRADELPD